MVPQTILEWQPFESMIVRELSPMIKNISGISEYRLDSIKGGTRLLKTSARPTGSLFGRILLRLLTPVFTRFVQQAFETFKQQIESDYHAHHEAWEETEFTAEQIRMSAVDSLHASSDDQPT
jgi:hypothetical protein